jgi:hypothetical protein
MKSRLAEQPAHPNQAQGKPYVPARSGEYLAVRTEDRPQDPAVAISWTISPAAVCDTVHLTPTASPEAPSATVHLVDGEVAWVTVDGELSGVPGFFARLVDSGHVSRAELDLVFALCRIEGINVCAALGRLGLIERPALRDTVRDYLRTTLGALLAQGELRASWTQSHFAFDDELTVSLSELLGPAERRVFRELCVQAGGAPARAHDDARIPLRRTARVDTVRGPVMMTTVDFSTAGARLRAPSLLPIASRVVVHINIAGEDLDLPGRVVRFDRGTGKEAPAIVVLWTELPEDTESALSRVWSAVY